MHVLLVKYIVIPMVDLDTVPVHEMLLSYDASGIYTGHVTETYCYNGVTWSDSGHDMIEVEVHIVYMELRMLLYIWGVTNVSFEQASCMLVQKNTMEVLGQKPQIYHIH